MPLNANKTFKVVFEARKGAGNSRGGFSLDDINISETECPHTWQIRDFEKILNNSVSGTWMYSPLYYSSDGYRFQAILILYQNYLSIYVRLVSGVYDDQLQWPCPWRQITFQMLDQNPHIQKRMSSEKSFTTDPASIYSSENLIIFLSCHVYKQHCNKLKIKVIIKCSFERPKSYIFFKQMSVFGTILEKLELESSLVMRPYMWVFFGAINMP